MPSYTPGSELPTLTVTPDRFLTVRYAGASGDYNPIHIDEEFAKQVGLPGRILHGLWTMAQVARAQGDPTKLESLEVQFRGVGVPGAEITTEAAHEGSSERGGLAFHVFTTRSTNQRGELVCEGRWTNIVR